jgi:hypothetical protein
MMQIAPDTVLYVVLPVQGVTLTVLMFVIKGLARMSRLYDQHRMMWYDYALAHKLPVDDDLRPANGGAMAHGAVARG